MDELERRWSAARPDAPAVIERDRCVTWASLVGATQRLGGELDRLTGAARGPCVIDCGRSAETVAAVLACLLHEHSFLLIDEDAPTRWLNWICDDCDARAHVCCECRIGMAEDKHSSRLPKLHVRIEATANRSPARPDPTPRHGDPGRELYRVYTSGSTGRPKGAAVPARSIDGLLPALIERIPELSNARCIGLTASLGFDAALQQIFLALATATPLAIPSRNTVRAVDALVGFWAEAGVEVADGTPTLVRMLAAAPRSCGRSLAVRTLLIGGEVMRPSDLANLWSRWGPDIAVHNLYGVAECGIDAAVHRATAEDACASFVPIGLALDHCRVVVADHYGRPVPADTGGELWIYGAAVGDGYPSNPEETAARFVALGDSGSAYRTGDHGRELSDGRIVVGGRLDRQLKLGGRRVDPAELEHLIVEWAQSVGSRTASVLPTAATADVKRCSRCVLSSIHPDAHLDASGLCRYCRTATDDLASGWGHFRRTADLEELLADARRRRTGDHDAVLLFSGGKDSTYALYRLRELGAQLLAFTFDNSFISEAAFENISRILRETGTEHRVLQARDNGALLAESIRSDATVCTGCFKGITTLGVQLASGIGSPLLVSGLSRGQIVETKLLQFLRRGRTDLSAIDAELEEHMRLYLTRRDAQAAAVSAVTAPAAYVRPVDYFRYDAATSADVLAFLGECDPAWRAPTDTGVCSSNCRANDMGIAEHLARLGYHNYEGPLSWEVRLGMLSREEALQQVVTPPQAKNVAVVRRELARRCDAAVVQDERGRLAVALQTGGISHTVGLLPWLRSRVPEYMLPDRVEVVAELPRLPSGKVDYESVKQIVKYEHAEAEAFDNVAGDAVERGVVAAWEAVLGRRPSSRRTDFFQDGGDSLAAAELAVALEDELGVTVPIMLVFISPTLAGMTSVVRDLLRDDDDRSAPPPNDVTLRSVYAADDELAPTLVLMPDLLGRTGPLARLFGAVGAELGCDVVAVEFAGATAWGEEPSIQRLAGDICAAIAQGKGARNSAIIGWSFGAILAEYVTAELARSQAAAGEVGPLQAWLLDPPRAPAAEADRVRRAAIAGLSHAFPQLGPLLSQDARWTDLAAAIDRACNYRDGERRVLDALPASALKLIRSVDNGRQLGLALAGMARALAALAALRDAPLVTPTADVEWLLIRPRIAGSPDVPIVSAPLNFIAEVHELGDADHNSMVDVEHLRFYLGLAERVLSMRTMRS
jgi:acyl-coenzyme A synthetase/AMP-(fatty) acid ligase/acyl carrier protein/thioesterase domain-containing protein